MKNFDDSISTKVSHRARDFMGLLIENGAYQYLSEIGRDALFDFLNECLGGVSSPSWELSGASGGLPKLARHQCPTGDFDTGRSPAPLTISMPRSAREAMEKLVASGEIRNLSDGTRQAIYAFLDKIVEYNRDRHWHARRASEQSLGLSR